MSLTRALARIGRSQATALRNRLRGWPLVYVSASAMTLDDDDVAIAAAQLHERGDWASEAPVDLFEREFSAWNGSRATFAFASGRIALRAALGALDLGPGDEVVMPGYSCVVVATALRSAGIVPVFADIELDTYGLDKDALLRALSPRTRAILIHHLYGFVSRDLEAILAIARRRGLRVIEDCAQATGAEHGGRRVGNFGDVAIFSGDPSKPFSCVQGGWAVSNDEALIDRMTSVRRAAPIQEDATVANRLLNVSLNYALHKDPERWWRADFTWLRHGSDYCYGIPEREVAGAPPLDAGCRMAAPIAVLASNQLHKLDHYNARRRANMARWERWCDEHRVGRPLTLPGSTPIALRYPVLVTPDMKRDLRWAYRSLGVVPGTWFVTHLHPSPERLRDVPNATQAVERCINFPMLYFDDRWPPTASGPTSRSR